MHALCVVVAVVLFHVDLAQTMSLGLCLCLFLSLSPFVSVVVVVVWYPHHQHVWMDVWWCVLVLFQCVFVWWAAFSVAAAVAVSSHSSL